MGIVSSFTEVFTAIGTWFVTFIQSIIPLFWVEGTETAAGHLSFLGVLAVIGLAISVFFLVMRLIENFLHLRT